LLLTAQAWKVVKVEEFGAKADNKTLSSDQINEAIRNVSLQGGGTVLASAPGSYLVARVEMMSNVKLVIGPQSVLHGSGVASHWKERNWNFPKGCEKTSNPSGGPRGGVFWASNQHNFTITGGGTVDGAGSIFNSDSKRSNLLVFVGCSDVLVEDLFLQNSSAWNLNPMFSNDLVFRRLHMSEGGGHGHNTDGFDPWGCRNAQFLDSHYAAGDDCVAVKSGKQLDDGTPFVRQCEHPSENIFINNITCAKSHGLTVGSEVSGGIRNVSFNNIRIFDSGPSVRIKSNCGRGAYIRDVSYTNISASNVDTAIWIDQQYGKGQPESCNQTGTTIFENIRITNLTADGVKTAFTIVGLKQDAKSNISIPIEGVFLTDVAVTNYGTLGSCTNANVSAHRVTPQLPPCAHT
jgi:polygalacturonase